MCSKGDGINANHNSTGNISHSRAETKPQVEILAEKRCRHRKVLLMLDSETLKTLPDLMAKTLYHAEIARVPRLSREEERSLVASARAGDIEARKMLIVSSLSYVLWQARSAYDLRSPAHDDMLDLAQVANLAMVQD